MMVYVFIILIQGGYMIQINEVDKRKYEIDFGTRKVVLNLVFSAIANKFSKISEFIHDISKELGPEFDEWFEKYICEYIDSNYDVAMIKTKIPDLIRLCDEYLKKKNVIFDNYVSKEKASKNSIFFDAEELEKLIKVSNYLKVYFILTQDSEMKPLPRFHKEIYNILVKEITNCEVVFKLYKLVSSKTHRYNISDKTMWEFIKVVHCKTTDMHINSIYNFLLNNILVTCDTQSNPIPYFSSVIDQSIKWMLGGVYKDSVVYSDSINTEDIHSIAGKDNLHSYCYNDTIGRVVALSSKYLEEIGINDIISFNSTMSELKEASLVAVYIAFPMISKIFDIPYRYLRPVQIEHSYLLNVILYHYLPEWFKDKFQIITKLMLHYNTEKCILKTTYRIKNTKLYIDTFDNFMDFKNMVFPSGLYSDFIGKMARNEYFSLISNKKIANFPLSKLEDDLILFYNMYFSGQLDPMFKEIESQIEKNL